MKMPFFWSKKNKSLKAAEEALHRKEKKKRELLKRRAEQRLEFLRPDSVVSGSTSCFSDYFSLGPEVTKEVVVVSNIDELPQDIQQSMARMKIDREVLQQNFELLLTALSLGDKQIPKRHFTTLQSNDRNEKGDKHAEEDKIDESSLHFLLTEEKLYHSLTLQEVKKDYKVQKHLGAGGYGDVLQFKVTNKSLNHSGVVAIKLQQNVTARQKLTNRKECSVLMKLKHPNICKFYRCMLVMDEVWMVMELMEGGNLKQACTSAIEPYTEPEIAYVAHEMLQGINFLHSYNIVHRDLKNLNVMLTITGGVKLIDFGACCSVANGPQNEIVGSPFWMAPEMLRKESYTFSVDIWSFAICMLELANKRPPNSSNVKRALFIVATRGLAVEECFKAPTAWTACYKDFLSAAIQFEPSKRATGLDLLSHPFLKQAASERHMQTKLRRIFSCDEFNEGMGMI